MARTLLEPVAQQGESKFARALGSHDFHTREEGLRALTTWLSRRADISELDMLKLWKGIFYCYWHSDKHHVQVGTACMQPLRAQEALGAVHAATPLAPRRRLHWRTA